MENTIGQEMDNNAPVYGCMGCNTTAGRMGCFIHEGCKVTNSPPPVQTEAWEKEFDRKLKFFDDDNGLAQFNADGNEVHLSIKAVKSFIRSLLSTAHQKTLKEVRGKINNLIVQRMVKRSNTPLNKRLSGYKELCALQDDISLLENQL